MKIVFVAISVESLAIEYLSSYLKKQGHQVDLVFDPNLFNSEAINSRLLSKISDNFNCLINSIISLKPNYVAFSLFTINYQRALKIAKKIKDTDPSIQIIMGGIHPTSVPEYVIQEPPVDIVCVGEGEEPLNELLNLSIADNNRFKIKNLWFQTKNGIIKNPCRPLVENLDNLPFPDKKIFYDIYPMFSQDYYIITSRGCPFACTYCANNVIRKVNLGLGKIVRRRTPQNIIDELVIAKKNYHPLRITFVDDVFVQDHKWLKTFASLYKTFVNIPYIMETHPKFINLPVVKLLKDSGCFLLAFGIQSASEKTRKTVLKRFETNQDIIYAANCCHRLKIKFSIDHIFNIPYEGEKEQVAALNLYNQIRPSVINSYWLQYFPKTEIIDIAIKAKILDNKAKKQINLGLASTSFVVGIGGRDSFKPKINFSNFQFMFMLLPILPKNIFKYLVKKKLYLHLPQPPVIFNIAIKFFINLFQKRAYVYLEIIRFSLFFSYYNIKNNLKLYLSK